MIESLPANCCPNCGAHMPSDAPQGLCPRCLLLGAAALTDAETTPGAPRPSPPSMEMLTRAFPQLDLIEFIGQGGMGCVFKARQKQLDRLVALKILPESLARDPAFAERFAREARALAALSHPNIVTVHDFGRAGDFYYLLMEFVDGVNLRQALQAGRFTPEQALAIVPPLCDALQFAHDRGIVHRDIKPENILLHRSGLVKVADFGIARMFAMNENPPKSGEPSLSSPSGRTEHGAPWVAEQSKSAGTPGYMAPEQSEQPPASDHRADIYSLGVVFYEMLTGERPASRFDPPSRKVQIDVRLDEVVLRALEREPARRYQQVSEIKTAVETIATHPARTIATSPSPPSPASLDNPPPISVQAARDALKWPARGLLWTGLLTALIPGVLVLAGWIELGWLVWPYLFLLLGSGIVVFGALRMQSLASRRAAVAGAIAGCAISFVNLACLPFSVWALTVLLRDDVRAAFGPSASDGVGVKPTPIVLAMVAGLIAGFSTLFSVLVFLILLPDTFVSTARVLLTHSDSPATRGQPVQFDPYRITMEFEQIRSKGVLYPVIDKLGLEERWSTGPAPDAERGQSSFAETFVMLSRMLEVRQQRNTPWLEIRVSSRDSDEAAELANAIAESYRAVRGEQRVEIVRAEPARMGVRPNRPLGLFLGSILALVVATMTTLLAFWLAVRQQARRSIA